MPSVWASHKTASVHTNDAAPVTSKNLDSGKKDARAVLYIDGKRIGEIAGRELAMDWEIEKTGIYFAVNYIGLLDELAIFNRPLSAAEVGLLHRKPGLLAPLKKSTPKPK